MSLRRVGMLAAAVVSLAGVAGAQGPVGTGVNVVAGRDQAWQVGTGSTPTFVNAFLVTTNPGWANFTGPQTERWISASATGSGAPSGSYTFRTSFDLTGYDLASVSVQFQCMVDNNFGGWSLNGGAFGGSCGFWNTGFGATQTVNSGFVAGVNTLTFAVSGDQTTDGLIVDVTGFSGRQVNSTVPEPSTYALMGTGLLGLAGIARRRRRA